MSRFPEPTDPQTSRGDVFLAYLDFFRERAIDKVQGLEPEQARHSDVPSRWSPLEMLNHLLHVERRWLLWGFLGVDIAEPWGDQASGRWHVSTDLSRGQIIAALREQGARTREVVRSHDLDTVGAPGPRWADREPATLERVLFHLMQEWARHLGHLDVAVEIADGTTGK